MIAGERQVASNVVSIRRDSFAGIAFDRCLELPDVATILDIGSGDGEHARAFRAAGKKVTTISLRQPADLIGDYMEMTELDQFDLIWASHVLEHQRNPGVFLEKCRRHLKPGGWLAVTVPPLKHEIVGGHVGLYNAGILLYHLILAGFDCSKAAVRTYGYNISVIVRNVPATLPMLSHDCGDIERLAHLFPLPVKQGFDGAIKELNWGSEPNIQTATRVPEHVTIIGLGPSCHEYLNLAKGLGARRKVGDEIWAINALGDVLQCDRVFHMDDVRIQEIRAAAKPDSNIAAMLEWLKQHPGPIYTSRTHPDYPGLVAYPLEDVLNSTKQTYFNSTAAYAIAYAIHIGVKKISCYGMDFTYPNAHDAERGRGCVEFWLGLASARGISVRIPRTSSLMDACEPVEQRFYGYDTLDVKVDVVGDGIAKVGFTQREKIATAEEIERNYFHGKHPNPLVESA